MKVPGRFILILLFVASQIAAGSAVAADDSPAAKPESDLIRVQHVEVISSPGGPVIVLQFRNRAIPVFVEPVVALSIQEALAGQVPKRPLTHDLMLTILEALDAKVSQVVITLKDGTFYAALTILAGGKPRVFDSRSSDAIALAIRFKAPILLERALVESEGVEQPESRANPI